MKSSLLWEKILLWVFFFRLSYCFLILSQEYITLLHACIRVAVTCVPISSYSTPFELNHVLSLSGATRLFVDEKFLNEVFPVAQTVGISPDKIHILKFGTKVTKRKSFWSIINDVRTRDIKIVDIRKATKDKLAYLIFSSGTGGLPKGQSSTIVQDLLSNSVSYPQP
jgi:acyl-CoA synthetase (AMP-forming)/AMP-acid ligase II